MIRGELDGDGGGSDWSECGGADIGITIVITIDTVAGERLGGGASNNLNSVTTRLSVECCESYCDRFPGC